MMTPTSNRYLYFTVFSSGMAVLAVELSASRLLGSVFGTSNLVWASIIGLILIYLTLGYFLGGGWADRSPQHRTMYGILAWGAFLCGVVPAISRPVLRLAAQAFDSLQVGVLFGSFSAVLILFSIPITLLGTISPFAIRLAISDSRRAGSISGQIYAISTLGSFIGTFLPVLILIPLIGTARTFVVFSLYLTLVALGGLWHYAGGRSAAKYLWMPLVLLVLLAYGGGTIKNTAGQLYETESAYNYIEVIETGGYRLLRLNEGQGFHSIWHPDTLFYTGPWEMFMAGPFFNSPPHTPAQVEQIAIVGLAAGTSARQATAIFGPIPIVGYEIDPAIIAVGRDYFDMTMPNLQAIAVDGRWGLEHSESRFSLIAVDAYRPPYIPPHLTSREFFQVVYDHLTEDGVVAINVGRSPSDRVLIEDLAGTLASVFPTVFVADVPQSFNTIVYATRQPGSWQNFEANAQAIASDPASHPLLRWVMDTTLVQRQPTPDSQVVFTDDWSPIEWLTNNMVLSYVLFSEMDEIK